MSFLLPLAFWLGLFSLPVIGFYLLKTRQRRRPVSTLLFWDQIKPKIENSPFWRKLRRWISLALQLLILLLVIAALARPAFHWEKQQPQQIVVVLDNSASMQAGSASSPSRWEETRERLLASIDRLRIQDEMAILTVEDPPRLVSGWTSSKRTLRESLKAVPALKSGTNPGAAFRLAQELTATRKNSRIEVLSDAVWPEATEKKWRIAGIDARPPVNAGITLFAVRRSPVALGDWQIDAEVFSSTAFSGRLRLLRDGQPMDLVAVEGKPGKPWRKTWQGSSETAAEFQATLQTGASDMLPTDNVARCSLAALRRLQVVVAGPPNAYLEAVLDSVPLVQWRRQDDFPAQLLGDIDLIIAGGDILPSTPPTTALLLINPAKSGYWGEITGLLQDALVTDVERNSPFLRYSGLNSVGIQEAGQWKPAPGMEVVASSLGHPLIFGQWDRQPRLLVMAFSSEKSDLPLRTAYPVLLGNLLQSLRDERELLKSAAILPGQIESGLQPRVPAQDSSVPASPLPVFPGWWLVLLGALFLLVAEWYFFNRRLTD